MFAGIDVGSLTTKAVLMDNDKIVGYSIVSSRTNPKGTAEQALDDALHKTRYERDTLKFIVATGYGRIALDFVNHTVTELTCHAKGVHWLNPKVRTVIDIGGQDSKVIKLDAYGNMLDFAMNDKCAAGTGRFLEIMANALEVEIEQMGEFSLKSNRPCSLSSTCTVFAESEIVSLIASGASKEDIIAGLHTSIARRVGNMTKSLGLEPEVAFVGGVAKNVGVRKALEEFLDVEFTHIEQDPQIIGALGAALIAREAKAKEVK